MIKRLQIGPFLGSVLAAALLSGCNARLPGQPTEAERWRAPADVTDFGQLYTQNCAGCHGANGTRGAANPLKDALYLSFVTDDALRQVITHGSPGTSMPAFSQQAGGSLTEQQIESLISGMRTQWSRPDEFKGVEIPPYSNNVAVQGGGANNAIINVNQVDYFSTDAAQRGAIAYQTYCARCHGTDGTGGSAGSIVDPNFLSLVSDQGLRTTVVVGRADLGMPDWRSDLPGRPMSQQEISDLITWVAAHRPSAGATGK
jgi:cytochrome c oxidase cbb3-type subunit III